MNDTFDKSNKKYGIIFKDEENDELWMGSYEFGTVKEFYPLADFEDVYEDLSYTSFLFVEIIEGSNDQVAINNLGSMELNESTEDEIDSFSAVEVLNDLDFPSQDTDEMFGAFLNEFGKAN